MRITMLACGVILLVSAVFGQGIEIANDPKYPLQIVSVSPHIGPTGSFNGMKILFKNTASAPIIALSASVVVRLSNSKSNRITLSEDHADSSRPTPLGAGQLYERTSQSGIKPPSGVTITGVQARVDYIEMADGTMYGPDPDNMKQHFKTTRFVRRSERKRLQQIYQDKGVNALLEELKR
jgi:hypothetical protein